MLESYGKKKVVQRSRHPKGFYSAGDFEGQEDRVTAIASTR